MPGKCSVAEDRTLTALAVDPMQPMTELSLFKPLCQQLLDNFGLPEVTPSFHLRPVKSV